MWFYRSCKPVLRIIGAKSTSESVKVSAPYKEERSFGKFDTHEIANSRGTEESSE